MSKHAKQYKAIQYRKKERQQDGNPSNNEN